MIVFCDIDGVLADFVAAACSVHGVTSPYTRADAQGEWGLERLVGIDPATFWRPLGHDFWAGLPVTPDGGEILHAAEALAGCPQRVCLLTAPCDTPGCESGKRAWIDARLSAYRRRFLMGPAKEFVSRAGAVLIDDHDGNVDKWRAAGGTAILVPRPWNRLHKLAGRSADEVWRCCAELLNAPFVGERVAA